MRNNCKPFLQLLLIGAVFVTGQLNCNNALCNYEAICKLINLQAQCTCIGKAFFKGPQCKELVDNCQPNRCKGGAACTSVLGSYFCHPCPPGYAGRKCDAKQEDAMTKICLHYNRLGVYGSKHEFLITAETLGSNSFMVDLMTINYMIESFTTFGDDPLTRMQWTQSNDLSSIARSLGIQHWERLPYNKGYYHVVYGTFWETGEHNVEMIVYDSDTDNIFHDVKYVIYINPPPGLVFCVPNVVFPHCSSPDKFLRVDIARYNIFEPVVKRQCLLYSALRFHFGIYSITGRTLLRDFETTDKRLLKLPSYFLWFDRHAEILQAYMIAVRVTETVLGVVIGRPTVARCYIFVNPKPVLAKIIGGLQREINSESGFVLDGRESRDYALAPQSKNTMTFLWDCSSTDDPNNAFCRKNISIASVLQMPAKTLSPGNSYTFSLTVRSRVNVYSTDSCTQAVSPIRNYYPQYVNVECVRNCEQDKFNPGQLLHLLGNCMTCSSAAVTYTWSISGNVLSNTRRLIYEQPPDVDILDFQFKVDFNNQATTAPIRLFKNKPPSGNCTIKPQTGVAYNTSFAVTCSGYVGSEEPLTYHLRVNNVTIVRSSNDVFTTHLTPTNNITMIVCDTLMACTETQLAVNVQVMQVPTDTAGMEQFLEVNNLVNMIQRGKNDLFFPLLDAVVSQSTSLEMAECIARHLQDLQLFTLLEVEQVGYIASKLIDNLEPLNHKAAKLINKFINHLSNGLERIIGDGEVRDMSLWSYTELAYHLTHTLDDLSKKTENIPPSEKISYNERNANDPLAEKQPPLLEFDLTVLERIDSWMNAIRQNYKCMTMFGIIGTYMQEPQEDALKVKHLGEQLQLHSFSIEGTTSMQVRTPDETVNITLSTELLQELERKLLSTKLLLQVMVTSLNPFWWFPDQEPLSTQIFDFDIFSKERDWHTQLRLQAPIMFTMQLIPTATPPPSIEEKLRNSSDMPIYSVPLPVNAKLFVIFSRVTTELRIGLRLECKPRGYKVRNSDLVVLPNNSTATFSIHNNLHRDTTAYISVLTNEDAGGQFSMRTEVRLCYSFNFDVKDPHWTTDGCRPPTNGQTDEVLVCRCKHMSTFAGRRNHVRANDEHHDRRLLTHIPVNWYMVVFYLLLVVILLLIYLKAYYDVRENARELPVEMREEDALKDRNVLLRITTGDNTNAGTTANISLTFKMAEGPPRRYTVYQDPDRPFFKRHSTRTAQLPLNAYELVFPIKVDVRNDNAGRYPSWQCHSIELYDLVRQRSYKIPVGQWIAGGQLVQLTAPIVAKSAKPGKRRDVKQALQRVFSQWFLWQPLVGVWQVADTPINRYDRTCIWIAKLCVIVCIVACYFERTTVERYERERERFQNTLTLYTLEGLALFSACYGASLIVHYGLLALLLYSKR